MLTSWDWGGVSEVIIPGCHLVLSDTSLPLTASVSLGTPVASHSLEMLKTNRRAGNTTAAGKSVTTNSVSDTLEEREGRVLGKIQK